MPPKRAREDVVKKKEGEDEDEGKKEKQLPEPTCPTTEERKMRAEEKQRVTLASKRANLKGKEVEESNDTPSNNSPVKKKSKDEGEHWEDATGPVVKFDPMKILAQAGTRNLVDFEDDPIPLLEESDSFTSLSQSSTGLDLGDLSIDRPDSPTSILAVSALHEAGQGAAKGKKDDDDYADGLEGILGCAVTFLQKKGMGRGSRRKGRDSLNARYRRGKQIIGTTLFSNVVSKEEDLALLERTYSAAELVLLSSPAYPMDRVHTTAVAAIYNTRVANERAGVHEAMTINQCLAWLARAAGCPISSLIPQGEYYPDAEDYLRIRLSLPSLPLLKDACDKDTDEDKWTLQQIRRCMQMMAVADLSTLLVDDRCILLWAIGVLYIDDGATEAVRRDAHPLVENVLSSCSDCSLLIEPLFNLTPLIVRRPDEACKWILMFRACGSATPQLILSLGVSIFVFICERAECTPDDFVHATPAASFTAYINALSDTMLDVFAVYNRFPHRLYHRSLVSLLNFVLTPSALQFCDEKSKKGLLRCIEAVWGKLNPDLPDDAIVITELRTVARRVEMVRTGREGRRTSQEVVRIMMERERIKEEKEEQLREDKREKELLRKQRKEKERSASINLMEDEEEEEEEEDEERRERQRMDEIEAEEEEEEEEEDMDSKASTESTDGEKKEKREEGTDEGVFKAVFSDIESMDEDEVVVDDDLPVTVPDTVDDNMDQ